MKKILFVIPFLSGGGAERVVSIWASELAEQCVDVHLIVFYRTYDEYEVSPKVGIHTISNSKTEYNQCNTVKKILLLRKEIKKIKPHIILPFISYVGIMVAIASKGMKIKVIETIRNNPRHIPYRKLMRILRNISVLLADYCIVQSENQMFYFPKFMRKKMTIIPNPISDDFFYKSKKIYVQDIKKIVAIGRLEKQKNFEMLIKAFSKVINKHPELTLNIYGEGSLKEQLLELINELSLNGKIILCGRVSNITDLIVEEDLFILSSNIEGMPNALMEAMALGIPSISTDCPTGPSELISSGDNGILIPTNNEDELIKAIEYIIHNPKYAMKMGQQARKDILNGHSAKINIQLLLNVINKI